MESKVAFLLLHTQRPPLALSNMHNESMQPKYFCWHSSFETTGLVAATTLVPVPITFCVVAARAATPADGFVDVVALRAATAVAGAFATGAAFRDTVRVETLRVAASAGILNPHTNIKTTSIRFNIHHRLKLYIFTRFNRV